MIKFLKFKLVIPWFGPQEAYFNNVFFGLVFQSEDLKKDFFREL